MISVVALPNAVAASGVSSGTSPGDAFHYGWQWRGAAGSSGEMPFWLHSNRFGEIDRYSANTTFRLFGSWGRTYDSGLRMAAGADLLFRGAGHSLIRFQESFIQLGYGHFQLRAGRKQEDFGLVHPGLSMGTTDLSHNARPIPKIIFGTDRFRSVPGTQGVFYYDASLAHGWLEDSDYRFVEGVMLHQKHLYLRMFSEEAPVVPRAGLIHFAQWGGESPIYGQSPVNLQAYRDVFFSMASDSKEILEGGVLANRFQNHLGTYDFSLMLNLGRYRVAVSRQFILEDTPNARFGAPWDGMWGAWFELRPDSRTRWRNVRTSDRGTGHGATDRGTGHRASDGVNGPRTSDRRIEHRPFLKAVSYEHINTLEGIDHYSHRDKTSYFNYYNHASYRGGWAYYGRAIGNPLFFGHPDYLGVVNNIMIGHHVGAMGYAGPLDWRLFTTYSRNYGAGRITTREGERILRSNERRDQWSFMLELKSGAFHPSVEVAGTLALDIGEVYDNNLGAMLSVRWMSH